MDLLTQQFEPADFTGAEEYAMEVIEAHRRQVAGIREWLIEQGYNDLDADAILGTAVSPADTTEGTG